MHVQLVIEQGRKRKHVVTLREAEAVVGRALGSAVRIPSAEVSRQHCRFRLEDGLVSVEDLDSVNGTFLNGAKVSGCKLVRPGDRLEVGPVTFVVEYELTPDALDRLRRLGGDYEMLEVDEEDEEIEEAEDVEDEEAEFEVLQEDPDVPQPQPEDDGPLPMIDDKGEPVTLESFEFESGWQLPQGEDIRDLLQEMDERGDTPEEEEGKGKPRR
jgi:pSer/pThr/pTyr-binding forkhead associated (FHA) protein